MRHRVAFASGLGAALLVAGLVSSALRAEAVVDPARERTGGDTTVFADGRNAFSFPAANLTDAERTRFAVGNSFFRRNWVEAPASTQARDGLGPHFIARSCGGCHVQDGRGEPPREAKGGHAAPVALLLRLSVPGTDAHGAPQPDPTYGDQLNNDAITGVAAEGKVSIRWTTICGKFADGTPYTLREPHYAITAPAYGPLAPNLMISPRIAPQLAGVGLLEAIPDAEIERNARDQAATGGAIRGTPNRVWDAFAAATTIGRFGWKANAGSLAHQTGAAFVGDIGITSARFPQEPCMPAQLDCLKAPRGNGGNGVEIDDATFASIVFYQATLAPPARRAVRERAVIEGQKLFTMAGCATCHRPTYVTGAGKQATMTSPALDGQTIHPYTDLLLHDMGPALADGRPDFLADGRQWKTPPLWGIGLIPSVNGHFRLLHDGRAYGVLEAILWHGGEAEASKERVLRMTRAQRHALVRFVESL